MLSLSFLGGQAKIEPLQDVWPPTWRLPSGAICVEASFKEPGRQKLVDRTTKVVAFLALAFVALGHEQWPWPELVALVLSTISDPVTAPISEQAAAWSLVGTAGVGIIVATFRLLLAAVGVDQCQACIRFNKDHLSIDGRSFEQRAIKGFELEPHHLGKVESHGEKRLGQVTGLYYRDAFTIILHYGGRRIEIAHVLGRQRASALLARLQALQKNPVSVPQETSTVLKHEPITGVSLQRLSNFGRT